MKFQKYDSTTAFGNDALEVLLESEVQNNLPVSFIKNDKGADTSGWLMSTIKDDDGSVLLTAACTPPFNIVLYETRNKPCDAAVRLLSQELKSAGVQLPGVMAEQELAQRFAKIYAGDGGYKKHKSLNVMRLDRVNDISKAPGHYRPLREEDLFYTPYWERAFGEECKEEFFDIPVHIERLRKRVSTDTHYIWEDGIPVSQAAHGRSTENGAVIASVYTPPHYRGKGYASSVVAELSQLLLDRGYKFCCLFADADNPISCGIYRKIGYVDLCVFSNLSFEG